MSIKDDAYRNLFEGTKNFLARILGCKSIWRLDYRNSWCAIVYKKTEKSFEVVAETHNPGGIALAQYSINKNDFRSTPSYNQKNYSQQVILNNDTKEVNKVITPKQDITNTETNKKIEKLIKEVQELKKLVLEQTKLITQQIKGKKDE